MARHLTLRLADREGEAMDHNVIEELPLAQRLALAYAPASARLPTLALLAFDAQLGAIVRKASEPILGQIRIAWWRDQLDLPAEERPRGNRVLAMIEAFAGEEEALRAVADGWEVLLREELDEAAIREHCRGRTGGLQVLARHLGCEDRDVELAGNRWALADLAANIGDAKERALVLAIGKELPARKAVLPRGLRPLAVLAGLSGRSLSRGGAPLLSGPASVLAAIRLGLTGR